MTANEKVARRKLSMLELAQELRSVTEACRIMGYSRSQFYEIKRAFQTGCQQRNNLSHFQRTKMSLFQ
jgi:ACT domain-containing protein